MNRKEKTVLYVVVAVLAVFNAVQLLQPEPSMAFANAGFADRLGPADELLLRPRADDDDDDDSAADDPMVVVNRSGRLSWGEEPTHAAHSVAFVHVGRPLTKLLQQEQYEERRLELRDELQEIAAEFQEELQEMFEELQQIGPDGDGFAEKQQAAQQKYQQFQQWQQQSQQRGSRMEAEMIEDAYQELVAAVDVVAERKGIDIVLRFIPVDEEIGADTTQIALLAVRSRTALRYPKRIDITDAVMEEMSLPLD